MILGYIDENNIGQNVKTVTEAETSTDIIQIIQSGDYDSIPEEWIEIYNHRIMKIPLVRGHFEMDVPFDNFSNIQKVSKDQNYVPDKCDIILSSNWTQEDIIRMDCDYIVFGDESVLISKRLDKSLHKNIPTYHNKSKHMIHFKKGKKKSILDLEKKTITTSISVTSSFEDSIENVYIDAKYSNYRGTVVRSWTKEWNPQTLSKIIDDTFFQVCSIDSRFESTAKSDDYFCCAVKVVPMFSGIEPSVKIKYDNGIVTIRVELCSCKKEYRLVAGLIDALLDYYESNEASIDVTTNKNLSLLRSYDPELFVANYSRESVVLPIPIYKFDTPNTIEYPLGSNKWYGAPLGYFPGLKLNRLPNNNKYKYIVTCHKKDNLLQKKSATYIYYNSESTFPTSPRQENNTLKECLDCKVVNSNVHKAVILQELYSVDIDNYDIGHFEAFSDGAHMYRYYEELYNINVILVSEDNPVIPKCPSPYFWNYNANRKTVIISKRKSYKILDVDPKEIIKKKLQQTRRYPFSSGATAQYVDYYGKRRMVLVPQEQGGDKWIESVGAPLNLSNIYYVHHSIVNASNITQDFFETLGINYKEQQGSQRHYIIDS